MIEIFSYIMNIIFASGHVNNRGNDIDKYHDALNGLKQKVYNVAIDANTSFNITDTFEKSNMMRLVATELHHLVGECQDFNKNYQNFHYDEIVSKPLNLFRKEATGSGEKTLDERNEGINKLSVSLTQAIDSCRIQNKWRFAFMFWVKI